MLLSINQKKRSYLILFSALVIPIILVGIWGQLMDIDNDSVCNLDGFLDNLSQLLGAVVGIIFTISTLAITIASDKYTARTFSQFISDWKAWAVLIGVILVIILATISIGVELPISPKWHYLGMVWLFIYSIEALVYYVWHTLNSLKPETLAKTFLDKGIKSIDSLDKDELNNVVANLGNLFVRWVEQRDEPLAKRYLNTLAELQKHWALNTIETREDTDFWNIYSTQYQSPIVEEHNRIFRFVFAQSSENLKSACFTFLSNSITDLVFQDNNSKKLQALFKQYNNLFRFVIQQDKTSSLQHRFVSFYRSLIRTENNQYLTICTESFKEMVEIIIEVDDIALWNHSLDRFTTDYNKPLDRLQDNLQNNLRKLLHSFLLSSPNYSWWLNFSYFISNILQPISNETREKIFNIGFNRILKILPSHILENPYHTQDVRKGFHQLKTTMALMDAFYQINLSLFAEGKYDYVVRLWTFQGSNYGDGVKWLPLNPGFLTAQMMRYKHLAFGLIKNRNPLYSEETYVYQYYLLCLAYVLLHIENPKHYIFEPLERFVPLLDYEFHRQGDLVRIFPNIFDGQYDEFDSVVFEELCAQYIFLRNFPYVKDVVLKQYDSVLRLQNQILDTAFENKFLEGMQKAKTWLESPTLNEHINKQKLNVLKLLPEKMYRYQKDFQNMYKKIDERLKILVKDTTPPQNMDYEILFSEFSVHGKEIFTVDTLYNKDSLRECINSLYQKENDLIFKTIQLHSEIAPVTVSTLTEQDLKDAIETLHKRYYTDYLIMFTYRNFYENNVHLSQNQVVNGKTITLLESVINTSHKDICLFIPSSIQWTIRDTPRLVSQHRDADEAQLHLSTNEVVACNVVMSHGIIWFRIN